MSNGSLRACLLGGFTIEYAGRTVAIDRNGGSKLSQLLQMVLMAGETGISKQELASNLYGESEVEYLNRSLNSLIFRLRKAVSSELGADFDCLSIRRGVCRWNTQVSLSVDAIDFKMLVEQGLQETAEDEKRETLLSACRLYKGEFLPQVLEEWSIYYSHDLKELHSKALKALYPLMARQNRYEELLLLLNRAAEIYPLEEWQLLQIDCLLAMDRPREAMAIYDASTKLYFEELGIDPSPEMMERFSRMQQSLQTVGRGVAEVRRDLERGADESGGYYCSYPSFVDVYHTTGHLMERLGKSICLLTLTIADKDGIPLEEGFKLERYSPIVMEAVRSSLRKSDIYTRSSRGTIVMLLLATNLENSAIVSDRITRNALAAGLPSARNLKFDRITALKHLL